mmetsp:Transcript_9089/g.17046  ORF Transcript_9089/g.17046 Transcript_9089/m.17046 type:complete len:243 (-) Transcript_9089:6-734(-)
MKYLFVLLFWVLVNADQGTESQAQQNTSNSRKESENEENNINSTIHTSDTTDGAGGTSSKSSGTSSTNSASKKPDSTDGFDIYQNKIEFARKVKEGRKAIDQTLRLSSTEHCDWRVTPLKFLKGEYCGKHYKVFGLNRHANESSKEIKKRYRKLSLLLHPDKNPGPESPRAFSILTDGYNCLMNSDCKDQYDEQLEELESQEVMRRKEIVRRVKELCQRTVERVHYHMSRFAMQIERGKYTV